MIHEPLPVGADESARSAHYEAVFASVDALLEGEPDWIAAMATVSCELHHAFAYFDWTGFYRMVGAQELVIGPYQGPHGCLRIALNRGVCGAAARLRATQLVPDVHAFPDHIACSATTRSELVVPLITPSGEVLGVLDVDSNTPDAFRETDAHALESLCARLASRYAG